MPRSQAGRRRTPQQRKRAAAARRAAELDRLAGGDDGTAAPQAPPTAPTGFRAALAQRPRGLLGLLIPQPRGGRGAPGPPDPRLAEIAALRWSTRGRFTMVLIVAVLLIPFGVLTWATTGGNTKVSDSGAQYHVSLAYFLVSTLFPSVIPIPLLLSCFIAMPVARSVAREPRSLRVMETLGFAAVIEIVVIVTYGPLPKSLASYTDPNVVAAAALADVIALVGGAVAYGPVSQMLAPRRRGGPR